MGFTPPQLPPPPFDPWVNDDGSLDADVISWFLITLLPALGQAPSVYNPSAPSYSEASLTAAVPSTPLPLGSLSAGFYRVNVYLRITAADGVSSSVTPFVQFADDGITCTMTGVAMTSDAIDEPSSQGFFVDVDSPGPISFGTLYASNTPNAAEYKASVVVERIQ